MTGLGPRAIVWLAVQIAPLLLGITATPLWARYPHPREHATTALLLSTQLFGLATLRLWLLTSVESLLFVMSTAVLMLLLATIAADQSLTTWASSSSCFTLWATLLFVTNKSADSAKNSWIDLAATLLAAILIGWLVLPRLL